MRYVISDIHGQYDMFMRLLERIKFASNDELFVCGDMVDKGGGTVRLLRQLASMPDAHCILGNHEYAFLNKYWSLMRDTGEDMGRVLDILSAYFPGDGRQLGEGDVRFVERLPAYIVRDDFVAVHAGLPVGPDGACPPPDEVPLNFLLNDRNFKSPAVLPSGGKCVFFGHTPTRNICGEDKIIAYRRRDAEFGESGIAALCKVHLDTGVWLGGPMGCFCVETCRAHYLRPRPTFGVN